MYTHTHAHIYIYIVISVPVKLIYVLFSYPQRVALSRYRNIISGSTKEQPRKILARDDRHKRDQRDRNGNRNSN